MTHDTQPPSARTATDRLVMALTDPDRLWTGTELAYLMSVAGRWGYDAAVAEHSASPVSWAAGVEQGYRQRVAEENATYPDPAVFSAAELAALGAVRAARAAADADRTQRYAGGPVPDWGPSRGAITLPSISVEVVRSGSTYVWKDQA